MMDNIYLGIPLASLFGAIIAALIVGGAAVAVTTQSRLGAVTALGVVGYGIALVYLLFSAPDLALAQILVETLTVLLFVLVGGVFAAAEMALVSLRESQIRALTEKGRRGRRVARLADDHPTNETIVPQAREGLERITEFVRQKDLVDVPDDPVEIIVMPEHQRGFAIGYCDSPGPLEKNGKIETTYIKTC